MKGMKGRGHLSFSNLFYKFVEVVYGAATTVTGRHCAVEAILLYRRTLYRPRLHINVLEVAAGL